MAIHHRQRIGIDIIIPFLLIALVFGGLFWQKFQEARVLPDAPPGKQGAAGFQKIILFFGDDENHLGREAREIDNCYDRPRCLRSLLDELFNGPVGEMTAIIPEWTVINNVSIADNLATIDLDKDFAESLAPGSSAEMLAVYAIVNTICINMPEIQQVKINLDGNQKSLLRHLDLSDPLESDYSLESSPAEPQRQGTK
jgi:spore germination protein GerM